MPSTLGNANGVDFDSGESAPCDDPPTILVQSGNVTQSAPGGFQMYVLVSSCASVSYLWERRLATDPPAVFTPTTQTTFSYFDFATPALNQSQYRCIITNVNGSTVSTVKTLTVV